MRLGRDQSLPTLAEAEFFPRFYDSVSLFRCSPLRLGKAMGGWTGRWMILRGLMKGSPRNLGLELEAEGGSRQRRRGFSFLNPLNMTRVETGDRKISTVASGKTRSVGRGEKTRCSLRSKTAEQQRSSCLPR
ncbi:hypothetical protein CHARACLAT_015443 [Characodon lateralis]|uniref:Uncharacterized protein n=1 Tax=Characodon lateralis TaxID=208331 RepID=A0ABU7ETY1_9TELE|nr:hypothetical protein [Characodon lateralis]